MRYTFQITALMSWAIAAPSVCTADNATLTLAAKELFRDDDRLSELTVGVSVRDGVATVWGAVPSAELSDLAETMLRTLPGVLSVRNETYVVRSDPVVDRVRSLLRESGMLAEPEPLVLMPSQRPRAEVVTRPPPAVSLEQPVAETAIVRTLPKAAPVSRRAPELGTYGRLEQIREREQRFIGVRIELREGVVRLSGQVRRESDIWELAAIMSEVPGVTRVVVGKIDAIYR